MIAASITLAVTPEQAQVLTLSETQAQLKLSLRSESDIFDDGLTPASASEPDMLADASLFEKVYNYVMTQSSISGILAATSSAALATAGNAAAGSTISGLGGAGTAALPQAMPSSGMSGNFGLPSPGNRVQVIEGTQVSDVYVQPR